VEEEEEETLPGPLFPVGLHQAAEVGGERLQLVVEHVLLHLHPPPRPGQGGDLRK